MRNPLIPALMLSAAVLVALAGISSTTAIGQAARQAPDKGGVMYHVVSLKFKETATPEQIRAVEEAFGGLKGKIPEIKTLQWGTNVSPEKHDKGFTHCFILTFENAKDRDAYLVHPEHKAFGKVLGPVMADVFVVDFVAKP